jgi:hypothetical protein
LRLLSVLPVRFFHSRHGLLLENLALRQQLEVLSRRRPHPRFAASDRIFWVILRRLWSGWKQTLILVQPETVVRWHRVALKLYWTWLSRHRTRAGRKCVSRKLRELIFRTPLYVLYQKHVDAGKDNKSARKAAAIDLGWLVKAFPSEDKRTFEAGKGGLVSTYRLTGNEP